MREDRYRAAEDTYWAHYGVGHREERLVPAPSAGTAVRTQVVGDGPPILFVHGGPNAGTTWAPVVSALSAHHRCIIIDRPGCGLSPALDYGQASFPEIATRVLVDVLDGLGVARADFVASSLGGAWTLWLQAAHPERVGRVVQMSAPAFLPDAQPSSYRFLRLLSLPVLGAALTWLPQNRQSTHATFRNMGHSVSVDEDRFPEAFYTWGQSMGRDTDTMKNDRRAVQKGIDWSGCRDEVVFDEALFAALPHRVHWFWGEMDPFGSLDAARRRAASMPHATLEVVEGGGHLPWLDDPKRAVRAIRATFTERSEDVEVQP